MKAINLANFAPANVTNNGIRREWTVCAYAGIERTKHDHAPYDKDSDVNVGSRHISIKSSKFSLMAGSLCEGKTEFDAIWELYSRKCHSNEWCYMTQDFVGFFMNKDEFREFVYNFCALSRESKDNGGQIKIQCRKETKKMLEWLEARA